MNNDYVDFEFVRDMHSVLRRYVPEDELPYAEEAFKVLLEEYGLVKET